MKSLDKTFRHLSREDKLKQLVDYGWLTDESQVVLIYLHEINVEMSYLNSSYHYSPLSIIRAIPRHLSREDKLKQLVDYGWLTDESYDVLLKNPLINDLVKHHSFHQLTIHNQQVVLIYLHEINVEMSYLNNEEVANSLIENVIGQGTLPVGLLPKIIVDDKEYVDQLHSQLNYSQLLH
jgi:Uri superfamily endonuclease